jgi:hypothetical protein
MDALSYLFFAEGDGDVLTAGQGLARCGGLRFC